MATNLTKTCHQEKERLLVKVPRKECIQEMQQLAVEAIIVGFPDALSTEKDDGKLIKKLPSPCNRTLSSENLSTPSLKRVPYILV